ncbi:MAG: hypothetical protein HKN45_05850, partial [Flavobacteriales bacterium]|nr:hypothetical protein [Flavobacteriales bacterium]
MNRLTRLWTLVLSFTVLSLTNSSFAQDCTAEAGTLTTNDSQPCLDGTAELTAIPNGDRHVPSGFDFIYVLTEGADLEIQDVSTEASFTVHDDGDYTIHTLVFNEDLDLSVVELGETTGVDVLNLIEANNLCASLDVAGVSFHVNDDCDECAEIEGFVFSNGYESIEIEEGQEYSISDLPDGFYVEAIASGNDESIRFIVTSDGIYKNKVENLVPYTYPKGGVAWDLGTGEFDVTAKVYPFNYAFGQVCDIESISFTLTEGSEVCEADAGTLTADADEVCIQDGGMISATPNGDINVPDGFSVLYVLTEGDALVIRDLNFDSPEFTVETAGNYTIHTLVFDETLDLSGVEIGVTTGVDVLTAVIENNICASLDVPGAPVAVVDCPCEAYSGKLGTDHPLQCLSGGEATISAHITTYPNIPDGYEQLYVLTKAFSLVILDVNDEPEFTLEQPGFFRIHSLVYDPNTLDLGIVEFGSTTGFDVFGLTQAGGGEICASLDVQGAVFLVLPSWLCHIFGNAKDASSDEVAIVADLMNRFDSYEDFEKSLINEMTQVNIYPNPATDILNLDVQNVISDEVLNIRLMDGMGRVALE